MRSAPWSNPPLNLPAMKTTKRLLGLLLALSAWTFLPAQAQVEEAPAVEKAEAAASTQPAPRSFSENRLKGYRDNPDYRYIRDKAKPPKRKIPDEPERIGRIRPPVEVQGPRGDFSGIGKALIWILIIAAVGLVLYQLVQVKFGKLWKKKSDEAVVTTPSSEGDEIEDIRNVEFDDAVQKAINEKRYRVAVRLLYLRSLRQLQDRAMINWRREKTNREYLYELSDQRLRPIFSDLTFIFEYIWYGEFPVDQAHFETALTSFRQFDQVLVQRDAK